MAWVVSRPGRKGVYIKYFDKNTYKEEWIPRKEVKHLDGKSSDHVQAWIEKWEKSHGMTKQRSERIHLKEGDKLTALWTQYQSHRKAIRKRRMRTSGKETEIFESHIVPFFVGQNKIKEPSRWHDLVPDFHTHLFEKNYADATIQKTLWTLERFGKHLVFQRYMTFPYAVQVPARENKKVTPLKVRKSPEDVLKYVKSAKYDYQDVNFKLMALLSYFAALRPSEVFALDREDLLTGEFAEFNTKTLTGLRAIGLGTRLSVSVTKTLQSGKGSKPKILTKNDSSRSVVNVWHPEAAKLIAKLAKEAPEGRLFPFSYDWLSRAWLIHVNSQLGTTIHDLRRASGLYLGREKRIPVTLLQEHMRHAEIETTMLYMREPSVPEKVESSFQDFNDVI